MLVACGGSDGAHDVIDCEPDSGYAIGQRCERACAAGTACAANDTACQTALPVCSVPSTGGFPTCPPQLVTVYDGKYGCCADSTRDGQVNVPLWTECEGQ